MPVDGKEPFGAQCCSEGRARAIHVEHLRESVCMPQAGLRRRWCLRRTQGVLYVILKKGDNMWPSIRADANVKLSTISPEKGSKPRGKQR